MTFNQVWVNRRVGRLSSRMTEQTGAASQARAKPMAHTGHIREISPTAILVCHNCDIYKTPSSSLKTSPPDQATLGAVPPVPTASIFSRMPQLLPKAPMKVRSLPFFSHINKTQGEIVFPTGERIRAGLPDAVRSFLWTLKAKVCGARTPLTTRASREYQCLLEMLASGRWACWGKRQPLELLPGSSGSDLRAWSVSQFGLYEERGNGKLLADT